MKKIISLLSIIITTFSVASCYAESNRNSNSDAKNMNNNQVISAQPDNKAFIELFDYEIQNRAFALNSMKTAAESSTNPALPFFKAYLALEQLNQNHFSPIAKKHQLNMAPRWWTRTRTTLGLWGSALFPDIGLKVMHRVTVKYIPQLEALEDLSSAEDKKFFSYVVAQEQAQADASNLLLKGNIAQAAALLNNFVLQNKHHSFN